MGDYSLYAMGFVGDKRKDDLTEWRKTQNQPGYSIRPPQESYMPPEEDLPIPEEFISIFQIPLPEEGLGGMFPLGDIEYDLEDVLGSYTSEAFEDGLGAVTAWTPFKFSKAPIFVNTTNAVKGMATLPKWFFKFTMNYLSKGLKLKSMPKFVDRLSFPDSKAPVVRQIKKIIFSQIPSMKSYLTTFKKYAAGNTLIKLASEINNWGIYASKVYPGNKITYKATPWTNLKRIRSKIKNVKKFMETTSKVGKIMYTVTKNGLLQMYNLSKKTVDLLSSAPTLMNTAFKSATSTINNSIKSVYKTLKDTGTKYSKSVQAWVKKYLAKIQKHISGWLQQIKNYIKGMMDALKKDIGLIVDWIRYNIQKLGKAIIKDFTATKDWIVKNLTGLASNIQGNVGRMGTEIKESAQAEINKFKNQLITTKNDLKKEFDQTIAARQAQLQAWGNTLQVNFAKKIAGVQSSLDAKAASLDAKISGATEKVDVMVQKVSDLTSLIDKIQNRSDLLRGNVLKLSERSSLMESSMSKTEERTELLETDLSKMDAKTAEVDARITEADKKQIEIDNKLDRFKTYTDSKFSQLERLIGEKKAITPVTEEPEEKGFPFAIPGF